MFPLLLLLHQVSIHLLSPLTRHLFKRGIMQSGTLNAPWSYMTAERAVEIARKLLDDVGCNGTTNLEDNPERVMSCLGAVDSKTISSMQWNSYTAILGFTSAPTIDGELVPKHPLAMIEDMSKDDNLTEIIIGSNQDEGKGSRLPINRLFIIIYIPFRLIMTVEGIRDAEVDWHRLEYIQSMYILVPYVPHLGEIKVFWTFW